jgi:hypothetical protein
LINLKGVCPDPLVVQTSWYPQSEHGAVYQFLGPQSTIDAAHKRVTGPLTVRGKSTGIRIQVRAGAQRSKQSGQTPSGGGDQAGLDACQVPQPPVGGGGADQQEVHAGRAGDKAAHHEHPVVLVAALSPVGVAPAGLVAAVQALDDHALQALLGGRGPHLGALVDEARGGLPGRPGQLQRLQPRAPPVLDGSPAKRAADITSVRRWR